MAKEYDFNKMWRVSVPKCLRDGAYFDRWDEETSLIESNCCFKVDDNAFYMSWMADGKDAQVLDLTQVSEARRGGLPKDTKLLFDLEQRSSRDNLEDRSLTLVWGLDYVNLNYTHLVAQDVQTAMTWHESLQKVLHNFRVYHVCPMTCLLKHWTMICMSVNERRKIPVRSITRTFASGKTEKMVMQCLIELRLCSGKNDEIEPNDFTFEKFYELYLKICPRTDVLELVAQINGGVPTDYLTCEQLVPFFNEKQRDPRLNEILFPFYDKIRVQQLIMKYDQHEVDCQKKGRFCIDGFLRFLMSDDNAPVFLDRIEVYQDMDQPLCHYFINSSHNTYLTGRQFGGKSSVEIYRQVLLSGCRCVELDCWDGTGDDRGEPIITHGKAMCTDVLFKDVIVAIRDTAFVTSEFPVILSFENHCSKNNQLKMARYCMDILGDLLLSKYLDSHPLEASVMLPSPLLLKRKILIKNKRLRPEDEKKQLEEFLKMGKIEEDVEDADNVDGGIGDENLSEGQGDDDEDDDDDTNDESPQRPSRSRSHSLAGTGKIKNNLKQLVDPSTSTENEAHPELKSVEASSIKNKFRSFTKMNTNPKEGANPVVVEDDDKLILETALVESYTYTGATTKIHPLLSSLVNYTHPVRFQGFDISEHTNCHFHMSSFSESTGLGYLKTSALEFVNYNKRQLGRIYPKGGRVDSSNFLPQIFWNAGVQMVALNFQTPDLAMQLNQGRFEYNGNCGYLLKPDFMRRPDRMFDPFSESPVDGVIAAYCSVQIISGQFLSDKKIGTYVEVEMYGLPTDTIRKEFRTRVVPTNGLNPVFNEEPFVFRKVVLPELAVIRIAVYDENNKLIGQRILPLDGLQAGYRHISLRTETSLPMTLPTIFCHIVLKTYIPEGLADLVAALADPKKDLEKKRQNQLKNMGAEEIEDSSTPQSRKLGPIKSSPNVLNSVSSSNNIQPLPSYTSNSIIKDEKDSSQNSGAQSQTSAANIEPIKIDELRKDKSFLKLQRRHQKDLDDFKRRHAKERAHMQKQQCHMIEKILAEHNKKETAGRRRSSSNFSAAHSSGNVGGAVHSTLTVTNSYNPSHSTNSNKHSSAPTSPRDQQLNELLRNHDAKVQSVVSQQTDDWSNLIKRQLEEEHQTRRTQKIEEWALLKKLMDEAHQQQMNVLKQKLEGENKALKQQQTKKSMDDSKLIQSDKNIKTKAEKDRRVKEVQDKNLKTFVEERKRLVVKHQRQEEQLCKSQGEQKESLEKEARKALEAVDQLHAEALLAVKPQTLV